jgi:KEOPS complex subunit Cgi121
VRLVEGVVEIDDVDGFVRRLGEVGADHGVTVQAFDARYVVSRRHLERAVELADRAIDRGENVARDRGVEIMLYAAGRRQIDRALALGVSAGEQRVVVVVDAPGEDDSQDEAAAVAGVERLLGSDSDPETETNPETGTETEPTLGAYDERLVREYFDVDDPELAAVEGGLADVVLERVALLDVEK